MLEKRGGMRLTTLEEEKGSYLRSPLKKHNPSGSILRKGPVQEMRSYQQHLIDTARLRVAAQTLSGKKGGRNQGVM